MKKNKNIFQIFVPLCGWSFDVFKKGLFLKKKEKKQSVYFLFLRKERNKYLRVKVRLVRQREPSTLNTFENVTGVMSAFVSPLFLDFFVVYSLYQTALTVDGLFSNFFLFLHTLSFLNSKKVG